MDENTRLEAHARWVSVASDLEIANFLTSAFGQETSRRWTGRPHRKCAPDKTVLHVTTACLSQAPGNLDSLSWFLGQGILGPDYDEVSASRLVSHVMRVYSPATEESTFSEALERHQAGELESYLAEAEGVTAEYARELYPSLGAKNDWWNENHYGYPG